MKTKKLIIKIILMLTIILSAVSCIYLIDPYNGGWDGSIKEPENDGINYIINTPEELAWIMEEVNSGNDFSGRTLKIESDIRFNRKEISGIATGKETRVFNGTIEGNGHTISSFEIRKSSESYIGFVGHLGTAGTIQNLIIDGIIIKGNTFVGGIAGLN